MADVDYGNKRYPAYVKVQPNWTLIAEQDATHGICVTYNNSSQFTQFKAVYIDPAAGVYKLVDDNGCVFIGVQCVTIGVRNKVNTNEKSTSLYEDE